MLAILAVCARLEKLANFARKILNHVFQVLVKMEDCVLMKVLIGLNVCA